MPCHRKKLRVGEGMTLSMINKFNITETGSWITVMDHQIFEFILKKVASNFVNTAYKIFCLMLKWYKEI
jgi:hypothetical protein